eukprot:g8016.t1
MLICTLQGCGAVIRADAFTLLTTKTCTFIHGVNMWDCDGELEVDEPGYTWATQGKCISACNVIVAVNACVFTIRFGNYPKEWDNITEEDIDTTIDKAAREKAMIIQNQNKTQLNSTNSTMLDGSLEETGSISSLPSEEEEDMEDETIGKMSSSEANGSVIELLDPQFSIQVTKHNGTKSKLLMGTPRSKDSTQSISPSPSPQRGKVTESSPMSPSLKHEDVHHVSTTHGVSMSEDLPQYSPPLPSKEPSTEQQSPMVSVEGLPPPSLPRGVSTRLTEVTTEASGDGNLSIEGEIHLSPWLPCPQVCNITTNTGITYREKFVLCRSKETGIALQSTYCPQLRDDEEEEESFEECPSGEPNNECKAQYIRSYTPWSSCSQSCTSGNNGSNTFIYLMKQTDVRCLSGGGIRSRNFTCFERLRNGDLVSVPRSNCASPDDDSALKLTCTPRPCELVYYRTSQWTNCDCDIRTQNRTVFCFSITSLSMTNLALCQSSGLIQPRTLQNCTCDQEKGLGRLLLQESDSCEGITCSGKITNSIPQFETPVGHGFCQNGICSCDQGFHGPHCDQTKQINSLNGSCPGSESSGDCCESGIHDSAFNCCSKGSTLDRNGDCCNGELDVCGECNGSSVYVDALGKCCKTTLDAAGLCCETGIVDECGVCDGLGMTCDFKLAFKTQHRLSDICVEDLITHSLPPSSDTVPPLIRHAFGNNSLIVFLPGSFVTSGRTVRLVGRLIRDRLPSFASRNCEDSTLSLESVDRERVKGNGVCEIGETIFIHSSSFTGFFENTVSWSGARDCSFVIASCPLRANKSTVGEIDKPCSRRGICSFAGEAQCNCFRGYIGEACDQCEFGYTPRSGICIKTRLETSQSNTNPSIANGVEGRAEGEEEEEEEERGERRQFVLIVGTVIAALLVLILCVAFVAYLIVHSRNGGGGIFRSTNTTTNSTTRGGGNYCRFSNRCSGPFGSLLDPQLHSSSSSASGSRASCGFSIKMEPSSVPPLDRKSPFALEGSGLNPGEHRVSNYGIQPNPFLPSSSSNPATLHQISAFTNTTVDVYGRVKETQRMPSPDDNHLMTIHERSPYYLEDRHWEPVGQIDNIELSYFPPDEASNEGGKTRRYSADGKKPITSLEAPFPNHSSISSLKDYYMRHSVDENTVTYDGAQGSSSLAIDLDSMNGYEFARLESQEGQPILERAYRTSNHGGRRMSFHNKSTSHRGLGRFLFRSFDETSNHTTNTNNSTSIPYPTNNYLDSQNNEARLDENGRVVIAPLKHDDPFH